MALSDTLSGTIDFDVNVVLSRTFGLATGKDNLSQKKTITLTDGSSTNQAAGWCSASSITVTTGGITISLADEADPFGAAGDELPTSDPEGLKLRAIMIENTDSTNYITLGLGTNFITSWLGGTTPTVRIPAGGIILQTFPAGLDAMNDGADDEIKLTANSASCVVKISYIFG
jgi:hypothetical protein